MTILNAGFQYIYRYIALMHPVKRLSVYWYLFMGALGIFFPYYTLYLKENLDLSGTQVGVIFAMLPLTAILSQPFWGQISDLTGSRTRILAFLALGTALGYFVLSIPVSFAGILAATIFFALFSTSLMPMGVSVSLSSMDEEGGPDFGRVRVWGTIGFLCSVVSIPPLLDYLQEINGWTKEINGPSEPGLQYIFFIASILVGATAIVAWSLPRSGSVSLTASRGDYRILLRHPPYLRVLTYVFGAFLFLQGPMALFPVYIRARGGDIEVVSQMWIWMIILEIPLVAKSQSVIRRLGPRFLVTAAAGAGAIRWLVCAFAQDLQYVYPVQILHGIVVAGLLVGAPLYVDVLIPARLRSTGQGLLTTFGASLGGVISTTASGFILDKMGPNAPYMLAGLGSLLLTGMAPLLLPKVTEDRKALEHRSGNFSKSGGIG